MRVFVTGATGAIGPYAVRSLLDAGHEVSALVRSPTKRGQVEAAGATAVRETMRGWRYVKDCRRHLP